VWVDASSGSISVMTAVVVGRREFAKYDKANYPGA
jgi:hypothetical protein